MDPISSLSLACNILQLVEFSSKVVVGATDLYKDGATQENAEVKDVTDSLLRFTSSLRASTSTDKHDNELKGIVDQADQVGTELAALLSSLEIPKDAEHRKWKSVHVTVRSMYKREEVKGLESRLQSLQGLLNTWMIQSTRDETSAVSRQVADLTVQHRDLGTETNRSLEDMKKTLLNIQQTALQNQRAIQEKPQDRCHQEPAQQNKAGSGGWFSVLSTMKQFLTPELSPTTPSNLGEEVAQSAREARMKEDMRFWPEIFEQLSFLSDAAKLLSKRQQVLRSLYDSELIRRYATAEREYPETFRWIFDDPEHGFKDWLETGNGTYWVSGKPGAGKTTLMKYICDSEETQNALRTWAGTHDLLVVKHFFWISGTELQSSLEGLLRSLLFQILHQWPDLIPSISSKRLQGDEFAMKELWDMHELINCLMVSLEKVPPEAKVCLFVDGLDEYKGDHQEVINLLERLASPEHVKLCVSSRVWNVFQKAYGPNVRQLRVENLTRDDIRRYVEGRLLRDKHLGPILASETDTGNSITEKLLDNAQGVFLWVRYVVSLLLRDAANDPTVLDLHSLVDGYPNDIDPLFERMLQSIQTSPFSQEAAQTLSLCLFINGRYLNANLAKFWFLETERQDPTYALTRPVRPFTEDERKQFAKTLSRLRGRCMDFIKVPHMEASTKDSSVLLTGDEEIQFTHRTARDFLGHKVDWLEGNVGPNFDTVRSACKGYLASFKTLTAPISVGSLGDLNGLFLIGERVEESTASDLLAEFNNAQGVYEKLSAASEDIYRYLPTEFSYSEHLSDYPSVVFLAMAIRWGVTPYVIWRLDRITDTEKRPELMQVLLDSSLRRRPMSGMLQRSNPIPRSATAERLIKMGARPNAIILNSTKESIWQLFLYDLYHVREDFAPDSAAEELFAEAFQMLLEHNADPFVKVKVRDVSGDWKVVTIEQVLESAFPPEHVVFEKLAEARARLGKRGKFWRKIKRR